MRDWISVFGFVAVSVGVTLGATKPSVTSLLMPVVVSSVGSHDQVLPAPVRGAWLVRIRRPGVRRRLGLAVAESP
jgi:hypothetical protein